MSAKLSPDRYKVKSSNVQLKRYINLKHSLVLLTETIPWHVMEEKIKSYYSGTPVQPLRKMVALLLLQHIFKLSEDTILTDWKDNPYYQYFSGEIVFQWVPPCHVNEWNEFKTNIGERGIISILITMLDKIRADKLAKAQEGLLSPNG